MRQRKVIVILAVVALLVLAPLGADALHLPILASCEGAALGTALFVYGLWTASALTVPWSIPVIVTVGADLGLTAYDLQNCGDPLYKEYGK